ncbi:MAG: MarR family transcriptional regulator [Nocardioidaceae bacterium]
MRHSSTPDHPGHLPSDPVELDPRVVAFRLLLVTGQRLRARMDEHLRPAGLTTQQAAVLSVVEQLGNPSLSTVADHLGTSHQNARQVADALARKGMLDIVRDPRDQRRRLLELTSEAQSFWAPRRDDDFSVVSSWLGGLGAEDAQQLVDLLSRILGALHPAEEE